MTDDMHLIEFRNDGWTIQHPLFEQERGLLFDCPARWSAEHPGVRGRYVLLESDVIGDKVEGNE